MEHCNLQYPTHTKDNQMLEIRKEKRKDMHATNKKGTSTIHNKNVALTTANDDWHFERYSQALTMVITKHTFQGKYMHSQD